MESMFILIVSFWLSCWPVRKCTRLQTSVWTPTKEYREPLESQEDKREACFPLSLLSPLLSWCFSPPFTMTRNAQTLDSLSKYKRGLFFPHTYTHHTHISQHTTVVCVSQPKGMLHTANLHPTAEGLALLNCQSLPEHPLASSLSQPWRKTSILGPDAASWCKSPPSHPLHLNFLFIFLAHSVV